MYIHSIKDCAAIQQYYGFCAFTQTLKHIHFTYSIVGCIMSQSYGARVFSTVALRFQLKLKMKPLTPRDIKYNYTMFASSSSHILCVLLTLCAFRGVYLLCQMKCNQRVRSIIVV